MNSRIWAEIAGFAGVTLMPAAGAQGELVGHADDHQKYHTDRGDHQRTRMLIPDSAHGTNPASSAMLGLDIVPCLLTNVVMSISSRFVSCVMTAWLALMLTNPNTLGLF